MLLTLTFSSKAILPFDSDPLVRIDWLWIEEQLQETCKFQFYVLCVVVKNEKWV
jgi:hypothetical protein